MTESIQQLTKITSVYIEGDKLGFNSKSAIEKFKTYIKNNLQFDKDVASKFIKSNYELVIISNEQGEIKFKITETSSNNYELTKNSKEITKDNNEITNKKDLIRAKLNIMKQTRTNSGYYKAKSNSKVPDDVLKEYIKLKKISKIPIPEPNDIFSDPEQYKPMIQMVLGNSMIKKLGPTHSYTKYFRLIAEKLGVSEALPMPLPMPYMDTTVADFPSNIEEIMKMSGSNPIKNMSGNTINTDINTDSESETD